MSTKRRNAFADSDAVTIVDVDCTAPGGDAVCGKFAVTASSAHTVYQSGRGQCTVHILFQYRTSVDTSDTRIISRESCNVCISILYSQAALRLEIYLLGLRCRVRCRLVNTEWKKRCNDWFSTNPNRKGSSSVHQARSARISDD